MSALGTRVTGLVPVDVGTGTPLEIPIILVHGGRPGPRVAATAGIHGAEYVSIVALREVALSLDPADAALRETLGVLAPPDGSAGTGVT